MGESKKTDGLPMPFARPKLSPAEVDAYRQRQKIHRKRHPDYEATWHRPSKAVAEAVWNRLAKKFNVKVDQLLPPNLFGWKRPSAELRMKQAFVITLDAAVEAAERGKLLTTNVIFDALAFRWSDNYRAAVEIGPARISYDMKAETVRAAWRDLLRNRIRLEVLYAMAQRGCPGLYTTKRQRGRGHARGYSAHVIEGKLLKWFHEMVGEFKPSQSRLLLADQNLPLQEVVQKVAGEHPYNVVKQGTRSKALIRKLEEARFYLDVAAFRKTLAQLEDEREAKYVKALKEEYKRHTRAVGQIRQLEAISKRLDDLETEGRETDGLVKIRSGFKQIITKRYHSTNFWPLEVTGKDEQSETVESYDYDETGPFEVLENASRRGRWFLADAISSPNERARRAERAFPDPIPDEEQLRDRQPLVGFDVSSSQVQILSIFLGLTDIEAKVTKTPFKEILAAQAWKKADDPSDDFKAPGFDGAEDERLQESVKTAAMTFLYGSAPQEIVYKLRGDPKRFGPGLGDSANLEQLISDSILRTLAGKFRGACQAVAEVAYQRDPYAGVVLIDPFDRTTVRWHHLKRKSYPVHRDGTAVYLSLPEGKPNKDGDYKVDLPKLKRAVLPCLVQLLDAAFAGFVVEELHQRGVTNVVSVHDAWLVPVEAESKLLKAIEAAGEPWQRSLGPMYDGLIGYLKDTDFAEQSREWKAAWKRRVAARNWPRFLTKPMKLRAENVDLVSI